MIKINPVIKLPARKNLSTFTPIFVIGCPRSGTSVIGECVGGANGAYCIGESLFIRYLWRIVTDLVIGDNKNHIVPFRDVEHEVIVEFIGNLCDNLFGALNRCDANIIVDHTPWNIAHIPLLNALYPHAKFIHVVRNPVAVSSSLEQSFYNGRVWASCDSSYHAKLWVSLNRCIELAPKEVDVKTVKYEDLCARPIDVLKELLHFCNLTWSANVAKQLAKPHASSNSDGNSFRLAWLDGDNVVIEPKTRKVEWSKGMSMEDILAFREIVSSSASSYQYSV